jgi:cytoplasmic iron level regulating protein YaaA (DUF328/UPF0246 family)
MAYGQDHLRISGLNLRALRLLDAIQPYRLEMWQPPENPTRKNRCNDH